jgi:membrane fusion protein, multidrug efflux system
MKIKYVLSICLISLIAISCSKKKETPKEPTMPVTSKKAIKRDAYIYIDSIGHVVPLVAIDVKSRVEGELENVFFKQGDEVKQDDLLFIIDPKPYKAQLDAANAALKENQANLSLAKEKVERYEQLLKDEYVSELDYDQYVTDVERYEALIEQNKADIDKANINLNYCYIYSPVQGKTGILQIDKGNMIAPNSTTALITIKQIVPIYVNFTIPQHEFPRVWHFAKESNLKVRVAFDDLEKGYIEGDLDLIDNAVDMDTGMITLRGIFTNTDKALWPGEFVKTRLILTQQKDATIIPYQAVQITPTGPIVFVIKEDMTVESRPVELGQREDENIIVNKGVKPGEKLVTQGQMNLLDGFKVSIQKQGAM